MRMVRDTHLAAIVGGKTMSDVGKQIEQWRVALRTSEALGTSDLDELESHLREEMERLQPLGLSEDEAFLVGCHRLGAPAALEREFAKINPRGWLLQRFCWGVMSVLLYFTAVTCAGMASSLSLRLGYRVGLRQIDLALVVSLAKAAAFGGTILLALWWYARHVRYQADGPSPGRKAMPILAAVALALGTVALWGAQMLLTLMTYRSVETFDLARVSSTRAYVDFAFHIAAPLLLAGLFIILYWRSRHAAQVLE